ncbi:HD domain-containing protein [Candidatus Pacearchaeota archaeon]|nr:HD domain-containing protein [Candidatus Pacearchaeota archaeon]
MQINKMRIIQHSYRLKFQQTEELIEILSKEDRIRKYLEALQNHSPHTLEHSYRVGLLCVDLGLENGFQGREIKLLGYGGLLHDIGKVYIPSKILDKNSFLTSFERELINGHTRLGAEAVEEFEDDLMRIIVGHHEYQINPYPRKGNERRNAKRKEVIERRENNHLVETLTQILAASDFYDALRSERAYQSSKEKEEAERIMLTKYTGNHNYVNQLLMR